MPILRYIAASLVYSNLGGETYGKYILKLRTI
jgi:hypothetical protein